MNRMRFALLVATAIAAGSLAPSITTGQGIAGRVAAVRDGKVRMSFAAKPEVCGWGNGISRGGNSRMNWSSDESPDVEYDEECSRTPVRVVLTMSNGRATKLRTYVGGRWRPAADVTDLGMLPVRDAADYLLGLASTDAGNVGRDAILPVTLADSVKPWPQLFRIARDESRPSSTRKQALFWIGQAAGDVIAPDRSTRGRESDDEEVKKQAVFAISQRRNGEAVPALIQVARNNRNPQLRRTALFWLGQTTDARAISLFEEILNR
jgi:hypothetical protein